MTATDITPYAGGQAEAYQARMIMTPEDAKALDEQVRLCTAAVLREGTDYGHIPGTSGDEKSLWRPGAQKLLQWFRLGCVCERTEVERDDDGRKHGITYRAEVRRRHPDGSYEILATCEGTADYDESKFYQSAEEVQRKARDRETMWAEKYRRPRNPEKWQGLGEYRADWNALMKRAQKRAIVGAVVDATAAGGIFSDREEDDSPALAPQDEGPAFYEQAIGAALTFTDVEAARGMYTGAAQAHRDGLITRRQQDHIQNTLAQREKLLKKATPVDVEDLARQAGDDAARQETAAAGDDTRSQPRGDRQNGGEPTRGADENGADEPGSISDAQLTKLHTVLTGLGFGSGDREQKLILAEVITGRAPLHGPFPGRSSRNLSLSEARKLIDTLDGFDGDRDALIAFMAEREQAADANG